MIFTAMSLKADSLPKTEKEKAIGFCARLLELEWTNPSGGNISAIHGKKGSPIRVAALMQKMPVESKALRLGLIYYLAATPHIDATRTLGRPRPSGKRY
jgi:hypothetical protein